MKKCISCKKYQLDFCFSKCKTNQNITSGICKSCSEIIKTERNLIKKELLKNKDKARKAEWRRRTGKGAYYSARWYENNKDDLLNRVIYAKRLMAQGTALNAHEIPDSLAELKIAQLKLTRKLKDIENEDR